MFGQVCDDVDVHFVFCLEAYFIIVVFSKLILCGGVFSLKGADIPCVTSLCSAVPLASFQETILFLSCVEYCDSSVTVQILTRAVFYALGYIEHENHKKICFKQM